MRSSLFCKCRVQEPGPQPAPPEGHTRTTWRPRVPGPLSRASTPPRDSARPRWRRTSVDLGSGLCVNGSNTCSLAFRSAPLSQRVCEDPGVRGASRRHSPGTWDEGRDVGEAGSREAVRVHVWPVVCSDPPPLPRSCSSWAGSLPPPCPPPPQAQTASVSGFSLMLPPLAFRPRHGEGRPRPPSLAPGSLARGWCPRVSLCCCCVVVAGRAVLHWEEPQPPRQGPGAGGRERRSGLLRGHVALDPGQPLPLGPGRPACLPEKQASRTAG